MPNVRDSVSIVRLIINRYRGSNTCNGQTQLGNVETQTKIGISKIFDSLSFCGIKVLQEKKKKKTFYFLISIKIRSIFTFD
jgi:hypothetical protein